MTRRELLKPLAVGFVAGAVMALFVAVKTGAVVTREVRDHQVWRASVEGQARICAALALAHREAIGDATNLYGFRARDARDELARTFAIVLVGEDKADPSVVRACSRLLNQPGTMAWG